MPRTVVWASPPPLAALRAPRAEAGKPHAGAARCPGAPAGSGPIPIPGRRGKGGRDAAVGRDHAVSGGGALRGVGGLDRTTPSDVRGGPAGVTAGLNHCEAAGHGDTPGPGRVGDSQGRPPVLAARYLLTRPVPLRRPPE